MQEKKTRSETRKKTPINKKLRFETKKKHPHPHTHDLCPITEKQKHDLKVKTNKPTIRDTEKKQKRLHTLVIGVTTAARGGFDVFSATNHEATYTFPSTAVRFCPPQKRVL